MNKKTVIATKQFRVLATNQLTFLITQIVRTIPVELINLISYFLFEDYDTTIRKSTASNYHNTKIAQLEWEFAFPYYDQGYCDCLRKIINQISEYGWNTILDLYYINPLDDATDDNYQLYVEGYGQAIIVVKPMFKFYK